MKSAIAMAMAVLCFHGGRLDPSGGHKNRKSGGYHYHGGSSSTSSRSRSSSSSSYGTRYRTKSRTDSRTEPKTSAPRTPPPPPLPPSLQGVYQQLGNIAETLKNIGKKHRSIRSDGEYLDMLKVQQIVKASNRAIRATAFDVSFRTKEAMGTVYVAFDKAIRSADRVVAQNAKEQTEAKALLVKLEAIGDSASDSADAKQLQKDEKSAASALIRAKRILTLRGKTQRAREFFEKVISANSGGKSADKAREILAKFPTR